VARTVLILATLDTKGEEAKYLKDIIEAKGHRVKVMDVGILGEPRFSPDIKREEVAGRVFKRMEEIISWQNEDRAVKTMSKGASELVKELYLQGELDGIVALGGSMGTSIALPAMKVLPLGVPKLMVSTVAFTPFIRPEFVSKDLVMMQSVADMWGLNEITREVLENAALMISGAVEKKQVSKGKKPLIGISTLGGAVCRYVFNAKPLLEEKGYEVAVFHATGMQGRTFEELIDQGLIDGVLDLCPYEVINELCGGSCSAGPHRMEAAARRGIPQVVGPAALGFFDWAGPPETFPPQYRGRKWNKHNDLSWEIKASTEEMKKVSEIIAEKLNSSQGPVAVLIPNEGFSERDRPGGVFYDPDNNQAFITALKKKLSPKIKWEELDCHANDPEYASRAVLLLTEMMQGIS
jgi:uncharacterized protein (UPF0261 family)